MALKDNDTKPLKEILSKMTLREKADHLWTYYKWIPIITIVVIGCIVSMIPGFIENSKEIVFGGTTVNVILDEEMEKVLKEDLFAYMGGTDTSHQKVMLGASILTISEDSGDMTSAYTVGMQLAAEVAAGELDYILMDPVAKDFVANQQLTAGLDALFSETFLQEIQNRVVYRETTDGEKIPYALDLTDTAFAAACNLENFGLYVTFPGNTDHTDQLDDFVEYLLNWKAE